ncbi:hypothetical protein [Legionella hackeliae]|uniref:Protein with a bacterial immunoglobulin-like domain n=1 Tax=Legionella hackeliae TaxID=449 RepID=A0A0A8UQH6_LEGHA|nr:hypothetical protein [Legionella hackeliae]KTD11210.1 NHL repeat protein [Legionella hackeliae]CEK10993.1 conserved exported protein of unknown function [Legionella hackeliae]STX47733.1 NHL repeat protein [Legionella hackeliae]
MNKIFNFRQFFLIICIYFFIFPLNARVAPWNFTPLTRTTISIRPIRGNVFNIQYVITNVSQRTHTLAMTPITGISQVTSGNANFCSNPFTLAFLQSCVLNLNISGIDLTGDVIGGPLVCEQRNALECYQPRPDSILHITRLPGP